MTTIPCYVSLADFDSTNRGDLAGRFCFECGSPSQTNHHVVPRSRGGRITVPLCGVCHGKAHHSSRNMETATLTKMALHRLRAAGKRTGHIPYGYELADDKKTLVSVPEEQAVIARIIAKHEAGDSLRRIAKMLNKSFVATKQGGKQWYASTVSRVLARQQALRVTK